jgi:phospholipase C
MSTSRFALLLCALIVCVLSSFTLSAAEDSQKIKHVVVLVMENRAFDHMVGFMKEENPDINGCLPGLDRCSNPNDPLLAAEEQVWTTVSSDAVYRTLTDPDHSIHGTTNEIFPLGYISTSVEKMMTGFISQYRARGANPPESIMQGFSPEHVPIVSQLVREFALVDAWFAGVPGPTEPNRCYCVSATSHGMGTNDVETMVRGMYAGSEISKFQ